MGAALVFVGVVAAFVFAMVLMAIQFEAVRELSRGFQPCIQLRTTDVWRKCETKLNALLQFVTEIDGLPSISFTFVRNRKTRLPIIVTHGWLGSLIEQLKIIDPLANPTAHGASRTVVRIRSASERRPAAVGAVAVLLGADASFQPGQPAAR